MKIWISIGLQNQNQMKVCHPRKSIVMMLDQIVYLTDLLERNLEFLVLKDVDHQRPEQQLEI